MNDLHRRRSSGLCFLLVFSIVVCVHTTFAATPNPSSSATEVATPPSQPPRSRQRLKAICSWFIEATRPRLTLTNAKTRDRL